MNRLPRSSIVTFVCAIFAISCGAGPSSEPDASAIHNGTGLEDNTWTVGDAVFRSNVPMTWTTLAKSKELLRIVAVDQPAGFSTSLSLIFDSRFPNDGQTIFVSPSSPTFVNGVAAEGVTAASGSFRTNGGDSNDFARITHSAGSMLIEINKVRVTTTNVNAGDVRLSARLVVPR